jgi:hypothetical protein
MDVIKTLTGLIKDVDNNDIDSLKDLYLELIYLRSELQAIDYTRCCKSDSEQLFCECPNNFDIYQETKTYHTSCNKEVKIIRTK